MDQDLNTTLSGDDQQELIDLAEEIKELTKESKQALRERSQLEAIKNQLENKLNNNLKKKEERLKRELEDITVEDHSHHLHTMSSDLTSIEARTEENKDRVKDAEKTLSGLNKQQKVLQSDLETCKAEEQEIQDKINEDAKDLEKISTKLSTLLKKKNEAIKKIAELGSLPSEAFESYQDMNSKQLFKKLESCNAKLKNYSHVNKKALDHFMSFSEQKEKLIARNNELDEGKQKIEELIDALDHRKYEAIHLTFKQVSKYFTTIFQKLVPQGHGILVMKTDGPPLTDSEDQSQQTEDGEQGAEVPLIKQFSGVGIKVSFTGNQAEMRDMQQLSGGQKSLVALALIFAIQKCDPAPFYLFDEIDQALDAQHRKAVADMIYELAGDAQFITTTFRPELLEHADKFYGVMFRNKVSHIDCVLREQAYDFVEDDQQHA
ncbi:SMC3 [Bugula neritina]|uniref:SMC3 n=1 Tax=Bugula neritina TaxID=10212 RepID=A0A7J7K069_BUGNE|nr:SMC3 [Bugula neritina]